MPPAPVPARAPVSPFCCPRCQAPASAAATPQICGVCHGAFVLRAGTRVDPAVRPPMVDPRLPSIKVRSAGFIVGESGEVAAMGVLAGTLDPITGLVPMDQSGIPYLDIVSIAVWRSLDVARMIVGSLFLLPLALGAIALVAGLGPKLLVIALPMLALVGFCYYRWLAVRRNFARVTGSMRVLTIRFDAPSWRRLPFHDELMRRAGLPPSVIP